MLTMRFGRLVAAALPQIAAANAAEAEQARAKAAKEKETKSPSGAGEVGCAPVC